MRRTLERIGKQLAPNDMVARVWTVVTIALCMTAVVLISQLVLMKESLRLDESQSIWQTGHSLSGMLEVVAQDVHMPLYHILLHFWTIGFGNGVEAVRAMSLVFFLASIPFVYLSGRMLLSRRWSLFVVTLFSLSPFMNWYANEARMYTLLALLSIINQYYFMRIQKGKKGWVGYAISSIIGAYAHYFFLFNLASQALFYLFNRRKFPVGTFKRFVIVAGCLATALAPWLYYFIEQGAASNTRPLIELPTTVNFFNSYSQFLFGFQTDTINTFIVSFWPLLVVVSFLTVKRHMKFNESMLYMLFAALLPVLLAFGLSFIVAPFFLSRYMLSVVAPLLIVAVWLLSQYRSRTVLITALVWLSIVGVTFQQQVRSVETPVRENFRTAAQYVEQNATIHDVIVLSSPFTVYPFEYYYNGPLQIKTLPSWDRYNVGPVSAYSRSELPGQVDALRKGHDYIYLLVSYDQGYQDEVVNYFETRYEQTDEREFSDGLRLMVYRVGYQEVPELQPRERNR